MNNFEKACDSITRFVKDNPEECKNPVSRKRVIEIYQYYYPEIKAQSASPSDICWNRANGNQMTKDFQHWPHSLEYIDGEYKLIGSNVKYTGTVFWRHKGDQADSIFGEFVDGIFKIKRNDAE